MATKVINALTFGDTYVLTTPYATCSTAAGTAAKVATITPGSAFSLETGVRVSVKFTNALSVAAPTLNVNSSGAKAIYFRGATLSSAQYWAAGSTVDFVYDGTYWQMLGSQHNSTYSLSSFGVTASATELNYTDGVTSNIQTQLNNKLNLSGGTITGQLDVDTILRNGNTFYNVLEVARTDTPVEIVVKTKIPYASGNEMPLIHLKGYAYGESAVIEMTVAFYIYSDNYTNYSVVSTCPWKPTVYLSSYTENNVKYVALSFAGSIYYPRFVIDYTDIWAGSSNRDYSSGWTVTCRTDTSAASIIPSTNKVTVPYKPIANDISGNAATATNVAWSGVTSKPSYYDAKAIKGITRSGTTFTYTCMDGTTGTFTQKDDNTTYTFTNNAPTLAWGTTSTIGTVGGTALTVTMPSNPNTNTYGRSGNTSSKIYLIGTTTQDTNNKTTYSHDTAYVGTDGCLYSNSTKVSVDGHTHSQYLTAHQSVTNSAPTLAWGTTSTVGTIGGTALTVTMPSNPNSDTKVTQNAVITTAGSYPVILGNSTATTAVTGAVNKSNKLLFNPSTGNLSIGTSGTEGSGSITLEGSLTMGTNQSDSQGIMPRASNWNSLGMYNKYWYRAYVSTVYCGSIKTLSGGTFSFPATITWNTF